YECLTKIQIDKSQILSMPTMIIDANGDYIEHYEYFCKNGRINGCSWLKRYIFPKTYDLLPEYEKNDNIGPIKINLNILSPRDLAETIVLYKLGHLEGADLQLSLLTKFFTYLKLKVPTPDINQMFAEKTIDDELTNFLTENSEGEHWVKGTIKAARSAFNTFREIEDSYNLLSHKEISDLTKEDKISEITKIGGTAIIDFSIFGAINVPPKVKQLVVAYLATFLYEQFTRYAAASISNKKHIRRYLLFIIEEAQNFIPDISYPIPNSLAKSKLALIATQGRKFGLCLCLVTQRPSFVDRIVLSMCNSFFIHRLSPEDISYTQKASGGLPKNMVAKLTKLPRGELFFMGQINFVDFPLHIKVSLKDRNIPHEMGTTNLIEDLKKLRYGEF
ncbi:MAG: ATP-binding protein, partial [Candidatus Helarchaeota archaeon]